VESAAGLAQVSAPLLAFGLGGPLGRALLAGADADARFVAVSRRPQPVDPRVAWLAGSLEQPPALPATCECILSLGPLDAFAAWLEQSSTATGRVIAIGSTSVHSRRESPDPGERAVAARLREAEGRLAATCRARGATLQLLRPTLVYGRGGGSLARFVRLARRFGILPLPRRAMGLRQPVHADDIAGLLLGLLAAGDEGDLQLDLPGGEALPFAEMLGRCLAVAAPRSRLVRLPDAAFDPMAALVARAGWLDAPTAALLGRLASDQAYDPAPARMRLHWQPRSFHPGRADLE
jgi:nucleoside-diphosphate-sugar epimerase